MNYYIGNHLYIVKYAPLIFFSSIILFLLIGWLYGKYRVKNTDKIVVRDSLAAAIFGLSALVLGFAFSNAAEHFDTRMTFIRDQASIAKQVYQSSIYLNPADQAIVQNELKKIISLRISMYENIRTFDELDDNLDALGKSLNTLNEEVNSAIPRAPNSTKDLANSILRPQLTHLLDIFQAGMLNAKHHPPAIIERFLCALLSIGALISGYSMAAKKEEDWFLTLLYLGLMGLALYVIFSLEFPHQLQNPLYINADFLRLQKAWQ
jgi:hypothetical protein